MTSRTNWVPTSVDMDKPSAARMYDYLLGGEHNFAVDREFVAKLIEMEPDARQVAGNNRAFLRRAVLFLMKQGIRQFLDLGSGIPTVGNVHEVAHEIDPDARVVYVDVEHVAVAHSRLLLEDNENAAMVYADVTVPSLVLHDDDTRRLIDFDRPVGLLAVTIGHYILDDAEMYDTFAAYRDVLAPGSFMAATHFTADFRNMRTEQLMAEMRKRSQNTICARPAEKVLRMFGDFELVEPGLVPTSQWRPEHDADPEHDATKDGLWAGVAVKR